MNKKTKNIEVGVRMRPLLNNFQDYQAWIADSEQKTISSIPKNLFMNANSSNKENYTQNNKRPSKIIQKNNVYEFSYDYVFSQEQNNSQVYEESCKKIVQEFLNGKNASIFMYGQTTSGKTHTMLGGTNEQGLIIYSLKDIFKHFQKCKEKGSVYISYMEIYNQQINDLLNPDGLNLKVVDDHPQNLSQFQITKFNEAIQLLEQGQKSRAYAQKNFHDHSSRSHTIFQIKLIQSQPKSGKKNSKNILNLVDLAGSQRVGQQDSNEQTGYINKSLFVLSNVIHKLSQKKNGHIPFRDSKLTRVLSSSLTTSSYTMFICTISPAQINFPQTLTTLRFANQSRKIQLKTVQDSIILNESSFITQQKQINKLKQQNVSLRKNLSDKQKKQDNKAPISLLDRTLEKLITFINKQNKENKQNGSINTFDNKKSTSKPRTSETSSKLKNLYSQYKRNVQILQKQYMKAMINLVSSDLNMQKQLIKESVGMQGEQFNQSVF